MITTRDRRETLGRERSRLSKAIRRPWFPGYIKDKRVIVDALEALILIDVKGDKGHAKKG